MRLRMYCWIGMGFYVALSVTDLILTFALLNSNGAAYESNPAAAAFLESYGWSGLALYKILIVAVFMAAVILLLIRRHPRIGASLITLGCAVLLSVTAYTHNLLMKSRQDPDYSHEQRDPKDRSLDEDDAFNDALPALCWFRGN